MKTKINISVAVIFAMTLFLGITACFNTRPKINKPNPAFARYISAYTYGTISRSSSIRIELTESVKTNGKSLPDSGLLKDVFEFEPKIDGHAIWISDRIIEFIPDEVLPVNEFFNAEFKLEKLQNVPGDFEIFPFQFSTFPMFITHQTNGLYAYNDFSPVFQYLNGIIRTSDYATTDDIKKVLSISLNGNPIKYSINQSYDDKEFYYTIDSIERTATEGKIKIEWNGSYLNSNSKDFAEISIPSLDDYSVSSCYVRDNGDQFIEIYFSDPLDNTQNLKGIITLQDVENLTFSINGNVVKVFLPNYISGDKLLTVNQGIRNFKGYKMKEVYTTNLDFGEPKPLVRIKGNGCILPNSQGLIFPFEAICLKAVDVRISRILSTNVHQFLQVNELNGSNQLYRVAKVLAEKKIKLNYDQSKDLKQWNTFILDLNKFIIPDPGAIYRVSIKFKKEYCLVDYNDELNESDSQNKVDEDGWKTENYEYDYYYDDGYETWYNYYDDSEPYENRYYSGKAVSRNIIASDLGMIYKLDDDKMTHAFISNMLTTRPISGATVEYYDYVKNVIASGITDANGMLDIKLKERPFLMVAKYGNQRGYLKLIDGNSNSLSKFDIEGEMVQKGVKGFIYAERGVWRPGDSIYLNFILEDKDHRLPPNHPVKIEIQDPNGAIIYQVTSTKNLNNLYDFRTATAIDAPTGNYLVTAKVGNRQFTKNIKIETVKPNRLKIYIDFPAGNVNDSILNLSVKWLHGAIAKNLRAVMNVSLNQMKTKFDRYSQYEFDSPLRNYSNNQEMIFDGNLNDKGQVSIKNKFSIGQNAPGMLRAMYVTKVFEEGGDFSVDRYSEPYFSYQTYIGINIPKAKNFDNSFETGNKYRFDVIALSKNGMLSKTEKLEVRIYRLQWRWWYERSVEDLSQYISGNGSELLKDTLLTTVDGKSHFDFGVDYPEYGRYLITVTDTKGGHQSGRVITIDWPYWRRSNHKTNENASMLNFACDKEKYVLGENIKISFPSPAEGSALISVESGTRVVKKFWIQTKKGETTYEFTSSANMSPTAYIHVTLLQPHSNTTNDLPIRMYGLVPVSVDDPSTHLTPTINTPDVYKPETTANIRIGEKNGKAMTYTLFMVDEGLLDLTRFKTPQPWSTFYAREALGVKTWDMYDNVIGAFAGKIEKLLSIGGDEDPLAGKGLKANRFKPVVKCIGSFYISAGQQKNHSVKIPNYVGSVRIMVVAQNSGAYGCEEKTVAVRKPLMVQATLPRVLGPGETVFLPVTVFSMEKQIKDVNLTIETNDLLTVSESNKKSVHFNQTGDEVVNFKLNVAPKIGIAKVKVVAICGTEKTTQEIEIDVRTPNPKMVEGNDFVIEPGKEISTALVFKGIEGTNKVVIEASTVPSLGLEKRLNYLIQYPHGCVEQTTSSVFPQLYLGNLIDLNDLEKNQIAKNVKEAIKRLQQFQTANGGFSYWPHESYENEWGTNYAGHFIIEAEKKGYSLPSNMKNYWLKYQQQQAKNWSASNIPYSGYQGNVSNQITQAYRLYVLALANNPEMGAMNRLREEKNLAPSACWRLAAAYKLIGQKEVALQLVQNQSIQLQKYNELSYTFGSETRDMAMILETLSLLGEKSKAYITAKHIAEKLRSDQWMNTQETAYCLLAMSSYTGTNNGNKEIKIAYSLNSAGKSTIENSEKTSSKTICKIKITEKEMSKSGQLNLTNHGQTTLFVKVMTEGYPLIGDNSSYSKDLKISIRYFDVNHKEIRPQKIQQGTDFYAELTVTNPGTKGNLQEMVINQIFPSGWEIHNSRLDETNLTNPARYQDIRDDRVYSYYDLPSGQSKKFIIQLNASYLGRFYLPTVYSEAMYDHLISARIPGCWVEVVK